MIREFCDGKLFIAATHAEEDPKLLGAKVIQLLKPAFKAGPHQTHFLL